MSRRAFTSGNWRKDPQFKRLCTALLSCKTEEEMASFLRDVATLSELKTLSERLEVAAQVTANKPYRAIAEDTGASTATITRVASFLTGENKGYSTVLKRMGHHAGSLMRRGRRAAA